jgi:hypothetical protein
LEGNYQVPLKRQLKVLLLTAKVEWFNEPNVNVFSTKVLIISYTRKEGKILSLQ